MRRAATDGVHPFQARSAFVGLAIAVAAVALDILAPFNFSRAAPSSHVQSQSFVAVASMWARLAAASQELLEEGERLQAEESLCDEAGSSSSESVGEDEPGCAAGGPLQSLIDAGFNEADALQSLQLCDNDAIAAVNLLLDKNGSSGGSGRQQQDTQLEWCDHSDAAAEHYVDDVKDKFSQLTPWIIGDNASHDHGDDVWGESCVDEDGFGVDEYAYDERCRRGFQGPIQMADGSFYDDSAPDRDADSYDFPSLDSGNFPALPASKQRSHGTQPRDDPPLQPRSNKEPIILEFASLPRAHRLQPPRLDAEVARRMIKRHAVAALPPSQAAAAARGDAVASLFASARDQAIAHAQQRNAFFAEATAAYRAGDGARAKALGEKGRWHNAQMQQLHASAMSSIFTHRNAGLKGSVIDLHGLHVAEALQIIQARLDSGNKEPFTLITGSGKHSQGQQARLLPHVLQALKDSNCRATQPVWGQVHVLPR